VVVARCDGAYAGVRHRRLLLLAPAYAVVFDALQADRDHAFSWLYHSRGASVACEEASEESTPPASEFPGAEYIARQRKGRSDGAIRVRFADRKVTTHLQMAAAPETEILIGDGPGASVLDRVPLAMLTRRGRSIHFAAALEPVRDRDKPRLRDIRVKRERDATELQLHREGGADRIRLEEEGGVTVELDGRSVSWR